VASQRVIEPTTANPSGQLEVLVQNRGTETLVNTNVNVTTPSGVVNSNITSLRPGETRTVKVPIAYQPDSSVRFESSVSLSNGRQDIKPSNDRRSEIFAPTTK
jgi:hypothetical protein